jgi:SAM-dependent methyltransferase
MVAGDGYVLGHTDAELKRLATQARLIDPITQRFLVSAGIKEGMRVLDVGSGAGDVAILLAGLVGPTGEIVGTDPARSAIDAAEKRVGASLLANVTFRHGDPVAMVFDRPFDAVVGRYVLQFIPNPSAAIARLSRHLHPDGLMFFHELDWDGARSSPSVPTYDRVCGWILRTIEGSGAQNPPGSPTGVRIREGRSCRSHSKARVCDRIWPRGDRRHSSRDRPRCDAASEYGAHGYSQGVRGRASNLGAEDPCGGRRGRHTSRASGSGGLGHRLMH